MRDLALLLPVAWRGIWRRPQRTLLSLASIVIVSALMVFMLSFQLSVYDVMKQNTLRVFDGYAELQPEGYAADPAIDRTIADPRPLLDKVASKGLAAAPRVNAYAILANGRRSYGAAVVGVNPAGERAVSSIPATIHEGRFLAPGDAAEAVVGAALARNLGLSVGGKVTLLGSARDGSVAADVLEVVGIYESGVPELDRTILEMPLKRAQETFGMGGRVNTIALGGPPLARVNSALPALRAMARGQGVAVLDWTDLEPELHKAIIFDASFGILIYGTLIVVMTFIILNALLMSVLERRREFAVLLAIGMRPRLVAAMVWLELVMLSLIGCTVGIVVGGGMTLWFQRHGIPFSGEASVFTRFGLPPRLYPTLTWLRGLIGPLAILSAIFLGGIVPYLRVRRLSPASAVRTT